MKKIYLILLLFLAQQGYSQSLINGRTSSYFTFIYKISNEQAYTLHQDMSKMDKSYLASLVDFYPTDSIYQKQLPTGHYLHIKTEQGTLSGELESVNNVTMYLLNNHRDLILSVHDTTGQVVKNARVSIGSKAIRWDEETQTYRDRKSNQKGHLCIEYQGHTSIVEIERVYNNTLFARSGRKIIRGLAINHIISPVLYIKNNIRNVIQGGRPYPPGIYSRTKRLFEAKPYKGYIVFNKPMYRPRDTVRIKAFSVHANGKRVSKPVSVYLKSYYPHAYSKKVGTIQPFRKGAFAYELFLSDSFKLKLDKQYTIALISRRGNEMVTGNFRYEDYELKQNTYEARSEEDKGGNTCALYLKGFDSNKMPLYDIRAEIVLRTTSVNKFYNEKIFIPDTLWVHTISLDAVGETKVAIPDTLFPAIEFNYEAVISFLNTENERVEKRLPLHFDKNVFPVIFKLDKDSLIVSSVYDTPPIVLQTVDASGKVSNRKVQLPYFEKVSPTTRRYQVNYNEETKMFTILNHDHKLNISGERTFDSLLIATDNPRNIMFRYFIFKNNTLIEKGETTILSLRKKTHPADLYFVSIQYVWGGRSHSNEYALNADRRKLNILIDHPSLVYPGQTVDFTVRVSDEKGKPVAKTDLTSYAISKKFPFQNVPAVPSFEKIFKNRKIFNEFRENEEEITLTKILEYDYLKKQFGLDSIAFYHFLYPDTGYYENRSRADLSQIAPYVVCNGKIIPVEIVYIDGALVYYKGSENIKPYSFAVARGKHTIALRTRNLYIRFTIEIKENEKLILSIDEKNIPGTFYLRPEEKKLSLQELSLLRRSFLLYQPERPLAEAYLEQNSHYHLLRTNENNYSNDFLVGPFTLGRMAYVEKGGYSLSFDYEPHFGYNFRPGILKLKEANISSRIQMNFGRTFTVNPAFNDEVFTKIKIENNWLYKRPISSFKPIPGPVRSVSRSGMLRLDVNAELTDTFFIRATYIIYLDDPDEYYLYPGKINRVSFPEGTYKAVFLMSNNRYHTADSIEIKPFGINYIEITPRSLQEADSFSIFVDKLINKWAGRTTNYAQQTQDLELARARTLYIEQSSEQYSFEYTVHGQIVDEDRLPIPGVNIIVKGTTHGTISDIDGYYSVQCPRDGVLVYSFIGFKTVERNIQAKDQIDIAMEADIMQLDEVVVVGFGIQERRNLTASVSVVQALQGRVSGIQTNRYMTVMDSVNVRIRGISALKATSEPLVILDGVAVRMSDVDKNLITALEVLDPEKAGAIYGSRAANGVILISTRSGATRDYLAEMSKPFKPIPALENIDSKSIRNNFRDYAFWKPSLITDQNGKATFSVTFPDDITGWNAHVLAVAPGKKSGQASTYIQSYKPLLAQIMKPHFLIEGDQSIIPGKITNYGNDPIDAERTIKTNGVTITKEKINITNSHIDSIRLETKSIDSVSVAYTVTVNNYTDGEIRKIPVYRKGVKQVNGVFIPIPRDTSFLLPMPYTKEVTLYAEADLLDVLLNEVRFLKEYPYYCNEQMASRLRAFLVEKQVADFRKQEFREGHEIEKLIRKLSVLQNKDGSWGWWKDGNGEPWITLHVGRVLMDAERSGFTGPFNKTKFTDYLWTRYPEETGRVKSEIARLLLEEGMNVLPDQVDSLTRSALAMRERIEYESMLQLAGHTPDWNWINKARLETIKGNVYWGEECTRFFDNAVQNTLIVYRMKEMANKHDPELMRIRNYFLESRKTTWRNTYESALILETLLPALINEKRGAEKPMLILSGGIEKRIDQFPFKLTITNPGTLQIQKTGASPVYFTAYEETWNSHPERVDKDFTVTTTLANGSGKLQAGKPVKLTVVVNVKKAAEFVQVDIPIPAGCSYNSKRTSLAYGEVYREYYLHKTAIFCRYLDQGEYTYTIDLLPRYSGIYTLNPAVAECMYFPTLFGREGLNTIEIK